jgi:hypothetical protein
MTRNFFKQTRFIKTNALAIALLAAAVGMSALTFATNFGDEENRKISLTDAPPEVQTAMKKVAADSTVNKIFMRPSEDPLFKSYPAKRPLPNAASVYEIEYTTKDGVPSSVEISAAGDVMEIGNRVLRADDIPPAARRAMEVAYPKANFDNCKVRTATYYEMDTTIDGEMHEVTFDAAGNIADFDSKLLPPNDPMQKGMIPKK